MTKKSNLFLLIILMVPFLSRAQQSDTTRHNMLKMNMASLVDMFAFPTLQFSYERQISRKTSLVFDVGYQLYSQYDTTYTPGFKAAVEFRMYNFADWFELWGQPRYGNMEGFYLGLNMFYRKNEYDYGIYYYDEHDIHFLGIGGNRLYDGLTVNKKVVGSNLLLGYQGAIYKNITMDAFGGMGVIYRDIVNTNREVGENDQLSMRNHNIFWGGSDHLSESSGFRLSLVVGLRFGYRF